MTIHDVLLRLESRGIIESHVLRAMSVYDDIDDQLSWDCIAEVGAMQYSESDLQAAQRWYNDLGYRATLVNGVLRVTNADEVL